MNVRLVNLVNLRSTPHDLVLFNKIEIKIINYIILISKSILYQIMSDTMKHAKSLSCQVYTYPVQTTGEFLYRLSFEKEIHVEVLSLFRREEEKLSSDTVLNEDVDIISLSVLL